MFYKQFVFFLLIAVYAVNSQPFGNLKNFKYPVRPVDYNNVKDLCLVSNKTTNVDLECKKWILCEGFPYCIMYNGKAKELSIHPADHEKLSGIVADDTKRNSNLKDLCLVSEKTTNVDLECKEWIWCEGFPYCIIYNDKAKTLSIRSADHEKLSGNVADDTKRNSNLKDLCLVSNKTTNVDLECKKWVLCEGTPYCIMYNGKAKELSIRPANHEKLSGNVAEDTERNSNVKDLCLVSDKTTNVDLECKEWIWCEGFPYCIIYNDKAKTLSIRPADNKELF